MLSSVFVLISIKEFMVHHNVVRLFYGWEYRKNVMTLIFFLETGTCGDLLQKHHAKYY
jgi:hypothetical protein